MNASLIAIHPAEPLRRSTLDRREPRNRVLARTAMTATRPAGWSDGTVVTMPASVTAADLLPMNAAPVDRPVLGCYRYHEVGQPVVGVRIMYHLEAFNGQAAGWYGDHCNDLLDALGWICIVPWYQDSSTK